jgi:hypothetical protein
MRIVMLMLARKRQVRSDRLQPGGWLTRVG